MTLDPPTTFGAPPAFSSWRRGQDAAFSTLLNDRRRFQCLNLPAGAGKTGVGMTYALFEDKPKSLYLTATKGLQKQLGDDGWPGLLDVRGMCVGPDTRVLTADLRWTKASLLKQGDRLAGFEEFGVKGLRRKWKQAMVLSTRRIVRPSYRLTFKSGAVVVCSAEHRWLAKAQYDGSGNDVWRTAEELKAGRSQVKRVLEPWDEPKSYDLGWMAGAWDGEGSLTYLKKHSSGEVRSGYSGMQLNFVQRIDSVMLIEFKQRLEAMGIPGPVCSRITFAGHEKYQAAESLSIASQSAVLTALGKARPSRLLEKLNWDYVGGLVGSGDQLISKEFLGDTAVVALTTSTGTFVAEGLASHNSNYECLEEGGTCEIASCTEGRACHLKAGGCLYFDAVRRAREGKRVSSNYAWWMTQKAIHAPFGDVDIMIADEAHQLETEVSRYLGVWLGDREVEWGVGAETRSHKDWRDWAEVSARAVRLGAARNRWEKKKLKDLKDRITKLTLMSDDWIIERKSTGWSFDPLWPAKYMEEWVWRGAKKIILMSATIRPKTLEILGVKDAHFAEYDSPIPVANRPVYYLPVARWTYRASDVDIWKIGAKADAIIEARLDRKGLLQPVSYARGLAMKESSRFGDIMLVHDKDNAQEVIAKFKEMKPPAVLVSPIIHTGYDFTAPAARYNIIPKVPFQPPSALLKARTAEDREYPYYLAMMGMVQAVGRVGRRVQDRVESFVLDEQAGWLMSKYGGFAPRYFHKAWRRLNLDARLPNPPALGAE